MYFQGLVLQYPLCYMYYFSYFCEYLIFYIWCFRVNFSWSFCILVVFVLKLKIYLDTSFIYKNIIFYVFSGTSLTVSFVLYVLFYFCEYLIFIFSAFVLTLVDILVVFLSRLVVYKKVEFELTVINNFYFSFSFS